MPVRGMKQFSRTCAIIQIKYVLPKLCHLPQYSYGSRDPTTLGTRLRLVPGFRDPGSVLILGQVTQYGIIAQVYRLSAVHCQMTRYSQRVSVLSESTELFNPVLCVSQWNLFWQQNQPIRLCLSNQVRHGRKLFPSPLGDFNRLFEGLIGELFKIWQLNMFYFFKWHQSGP